jgi:hypothetical protein
LAEAIPAGDVVWIDNLDAGHWTVWSKFLSQFQHACHARDENSRGLFCVSVIGHLVAEPEPDTALRVHRWGSCVGRLDVMLHLDRLLPDAFPSRLTRQIALAVATELAGTDAALGRRLAATGHRVLDEYGAVLCAYAADRGWTATSVRDACWANGLCECFDGDERLHSAALIAVGDLDGVERRVWQGQVRVLYPFIEECRVRLAADVGSLLRLPVETTFGPVQRAIDLEIGQLVHFLRGCRVPERLWRQMILLREIRHALAHLRPIQSGVLTSEDFRRVSG